MQMTKTITDGWGTGADTWNTYKKTKKNLVVCFFVCIFAMSNMGFWLIRYFPRGSKTEPPLLQFYKSRDRDDSFYFPYFFENESTKYLSKAYPRLMEIAKPPLKINTSDAWGFSSK